MVILQVKGGHGSRTSKGWQSEKISKLESAKVGQGMLAILGGIRFVRGWVISDTLGHFLIQKSIDAAAETEFYRLSDRAIVEISARFQKPVYGLNGARGMYAASKSVTRAQFQAYVDSRDMPKEFPGVRGLGFD